MMRSLFLTKVSGPSIESIQRAVVGLELHCSS